MNGSDSFPRQCAAARERVQLLLDDGDAHRALRDDAHFEACGACREWAGELMRTTHALRQLPLLSPPQELAEMLANLPATAEAARAIDRRGVRAGRTVRGRGRRALAAGTIAAALLVIATASMILIQRSSEPGPVEIARAERDVQLVLGLTGRAVARAEQATLEQLTRGGMSRAVDALVLPASQVSFDGDRDANASEQVAPQGGSS